MADTFQLTELEASEPKTDYRKLRRRTSELYGRGKAGRTWKQARMLAIEEAGITDPVEIGIAMKEISENHAHRSNAVQRADKLQMLFLEQQENLPL